MSARSATTRRQQRAAARQFDWRAVSKGEPGPSPVAHAWDANIDLSAAPAFPIYPMRIGPHNRAEQGTAFSSRP
jgi:hypothetical protein